MTREEHLLVCLAEECVEVAKDVAKALRFGLDDHEPGAAFDNRERIMLELRDVLCIASILSREDVLPPLIYGPEDVERKLANVERFMIVARGNGALSSEPHHG